MCGNPFSPPKVSQPAYTPPPPPPAAPEDDPEAQQRLRAAKRRVQEQAAAAMGQDVYTSGSGVSGTANVGRTTLG